MRSLSIAALTLFAALSLVACSDEAPEAPASQETEKTETLTKEVQGAPAEVDPNAPLGTIDESAAPFSIGGTPIDHKHRKSLELYDKKIQEAYRHSLNGKPDQAYALLTVISIAFPHLYDDPKPSTAVPTDSGPSAGPNVTPSDEPSASYHNGEVNYSTHLAAICAHTAQELIAQNTLSSWPKASRLRSTAFAYLKNIGRTPFELPRDEAINDYVEAAFATLHKDKRWPVARTYKGLVPEIEIEEEEVEQVLVDGKWVNVVEKTDPAPKETKPLSKAELTKAELFNLRSRAFKVKMANDGAFPTSMAKFVETRQHQKWDRFLPEEAPREMPDPWGNEYRAKLLPEDGYEIRSAGRDGKFDTPDDIFWRFREGTTVPESYK